MQQSYSRNAIPSELVMNKCLRNTYMLLGLTLGFSAITAFAAMAMNVRPVSPIILLVGFYGLLFLTSKTSNSAAGVASVFALTGFMGFTLGPLLNLYIGAGLGDVVLLSFAGTAAVFFASSAYVLTTQKDMSFLNGMMIALFVVILVAMIANLFLQLTSLHLVISSLFILFSTAGILTTTSAIIRGGETNYIMATVSLYVDIYNLFVSLLNILRVLRGDD